MPAGDFVTGPGYTLIASAKRNDDQRLITVVTGTASPRLRADENLKLLGWAYFNSESAMSAPSALSFQEYAQVSRIPNRHFRLPEGRNRVCGQPQSIPI